MKFKRFISIILVVLLLVSFTACAKLNGGYVQLPSPFDTDSGVSDSSNVVSGNTSSESTPALTIECNNNEIVRVTDYITDAKVDIKYATSDNFTGGQIYDFDDAYLRYGTVIKLKKAADALRTQGYRIVIWDGYRPQSAQFTLFENAPDPSYVSDPNKGFSSHSSGGTVDITLAKADGTILEMPSGFDEFSAKGDRIYDDVSEIAGSNSQILEKAMTDAGFKGYSKEWWHYSDTDTYEYDDIKNVKPLNKSKKTYKADCEEFIKLRKSPSVDAEAVAQIPVDGEMIPYCWIGNFIGVKFGEYTGYVSNDYVK
ncbi:MAG: M15 family metallopeptidase [Clostridia bacterium]|nr:M15 family metallopeptidase [Clostridia bacterium]